MSIENRPPEPAYPASTEQSVDTGEGHGSGLERSASEPRQGAEQHRTDERPADWTPPPGNPGSDQDAQADRDIGSAATDTPDDSPQPEPDPSQYPNSLPPSHYEKDGE